MRPTPHGTKIDRTTVLGEPPPGRYHGRSSSDRLEPVSEEPLPTVDPELIDEADRRSEGGPMGADPMVGEAPSG